MPKYRVVKTETATVCASNETEAQEIANIEFQNHPDADYEIEKETPEHRLNEIAEALKGFGVSAYLDDYRNNLHEFLRVSATCEHPDDEEENQYFIQCSLDDDEEFDGKTYALTRDGYEVAEYPADIHPLALAYMFKKAMLADIEARTPKLQANLTEVAEHLNAWGIEATVLTNDSHGFPDSLSIGKHEVLDYKNDMVECEKYRLFGNSSDGETWDGSGWSLETCEQEEVALFDNLDSLTLAGRIAYQIGRAEFDMETRGRY